MRGKKTNEKSAKRTAGAHHAAIEPGARLLASVHRVLALGALNVERVGRVRQQRLARRVGTSRLLKRVRVLLPVALGALDDHGAAREGELRRAKAAVDRAVLSGQAVRGRLTRRWVLLRQGLRLGLLRLVVLLCMRRARVRRGRRQV